MAQTFRELQKLHDEGRDHIWAYYTRNMVRPVALSLQKVDVIVGNPPWITFNKTISVLRTGLEQLSKDTYGIWQGGRYATHQDVAGLFYTRSVDLYLKDGGVIGMVMPHSALQTGQYAKWRTGRWKPSGKEGEALPIDFTFKTAWDLERLKPNDFFPVPASVIFARRVKLPPEPPLKAKPSAARTDPNGQMPVSLAKPLAGSVERWIGVTGSDSVTRKTVGITDTSEAGESPYGRRARQGATIVPRRLHYVEEAENRIVVQPGGTTKVNPRRGTQDKAPWRDLDLAEITDQTIESAHVYDVHLGETLVPYATLEPLKAVLPLKREAKTRAKDSSAVSGIKLERMEKRMRERWRTVSRLWDANKTSGE